MDGQCWCGWQWSDDTGCLADAAEAVMLVKTLTDEWLH